MDDAANIRLDRLPSAIGSMARLAYARAKAAGVEVEPLLKVSGLTLHQMEDESVRFAVRDQIKFLNLVADALKDDSLGFHLAQLRDLRQIGLLYYVLASSEILIDALQRGARYGSIVNEGISPRCTDGTSVRISLHYVGVSRHLDRHQIEFWMTAVLRMCRQLTGLRLLPIRVRLTHHRISPSAEFVQFFGNDVEFGATVDEITFAQGVRDLPIVTADPYLNKLLIKYCEEALSSVRRSRGSFRSSVENIVIPLLPHGKPQASDVARRLGLTPRTFARRLSSERLTFSAVLESLRFDLANRYLAEDTLPISQVAWLLGYREVGAFSHAFKRWTGNTPRDARSHLAPP